MVCEAAGRAEVAADGRRFGERLSATDSCGRAEEDKTLGLNEPAEEVAAVASRWLFVRLERGDDRDEHQKRDM
ncbi:hypothetical protein HPP92_010521 [Vanilla planifolia]|uniref:Uncharacterized protein n=1 Tax=Vanilla planifolia TaxID=51239 RepID=A0A835V1X0_VANPL|nr:hypothetical protein HPP92_010521 [Vanilla planifolia]